MCARTHVATNNAMLSRAQQASRCNCARAVKVHVEQMLLILEFMQGGTLTAAIAADNKNSRRRLAWHRLFLLSAAIAAVSVPPCMNSRIKSICRAHLLTAEIRLQLHACWARKAQRFFCSYMGPSAPCHSAECGPGIGRRGDVSSLVRAASPPGRPPAGQGCCL